MRAAVVRMVFAGFGMPCRSGWEPWGGGMAQVGVAAKAGHARFTYRLRVPSAARTALTGEWDPHA